MKHYIIIMLFIYLFINLAGYAWYVTLQNRVLEHNLEELIEVISGRDDAL